MPRRSSGGSAGTGGAAEPPAGGPAVCPYVKYEQQVVHRRELKSAPYNPRYIKDVNRDKLRKNLKERGLLNAPVWNRRTGNLVSGHQRLKILDGLMRTDDYLVPVDVVDLTDKEEREQNVFFNNRDAQGRFDDKLLEELVRSPDFDSELAGFDLSEVVEKFGDGVLAAGGGDKLAKMAERLREAQAAHDEIKKAQAARDRADFYRVVVFRDAAEAERLSALNGEPGCVFLHGARLVEKLAAPGGPP